LVVSDWVNVVACRQWLRRKGSSRLLLERCLCVRFMLLELGVVIAAPITVGEMIFRRA
jgi:hypothetical protein